VLHKTYASVDIEAVRNTDEARRLGRRKMQDANETLWGAIDFTGLFLIWHFFGSHFFELWGNWNL